MINERMRGSLKMYALVITLIERFLHVFFTVVSYNIEQYSQNIL